MCTAQYIIPSFSIFNLILLSLYSWTMSWELFNSGITLITIILSVYEKQSYCCLSVSAQTHYALRISVETAAPLPKTKLTAKRKGRKKETKGNWIHCFHFTESHAFYKARLFMRACAF